MAILWGDILLLQLGHPEVWSVLWLKVSQLSALGSGASCSISDEQGRERGQGPVYGGFVL